MQIISLIVAVVAILISAITAYLTVIHQGRLRMTVPSMVVFAYDQHSSGRLEPKVMVRCLLFSTGRRGNVVETLFARLRYANTVLDLDTWGLAKDGSILSRGGGLFVGQDGVPAWHHLVALPGEAFRFGTGAYQLEVLARVHGIGEAVVLWSAFLVVPSSCVPCDDGSTALWFSRRPTTGEFHVSAECRPQHGAMPKTSE